MSATPETIASEAVTPVPGKGPLVYRQSIWTRTIHWVWAICLFFLLLTGLQIFNAHPTLYIGQESGFEYDNAVLDIGAVRTAEGIRGRTTIFGYEFDTTGVFGVSGPAESPRYQAFPSEVTIPSYRDLATGRVIHFFFGWILVGAMLVFYLVGALNGHIRRDLLPRPADIRELPGDIAGHARLRFAHGRRYGPLQRLSYFFVLFILFPLIVLTGLAMSPGMNAAWPWLLDVFGGRQTARTIHFVVMVLLVGFFLVHLLMVLVSGPLNGMRSMITGWYRTAPGTPFGKGDKP